MTDVDRKTKNIVVRCLRPYKGYGLPREREITAWCEGNYPGSDVLYSLELLQVFAGKSS